MDQPPPLPFKDRRTWLIVFGILTVGLGVLCALFLGLGLLGASAARSSDPNAAPGSGSMVATYGFLSAAFIWLGIGSMLCRRWARALLLILSWFWLIVGAIGMIGMGFLLRPIITQISMEAGRSGGQSLPGSAQTIAIVVMLSFAGFILVVLPAIWVFFYSRRSVKRTCETRDPKSRWTDRCPMPVLAASALFACGAPMMLAVPLTMRSVTPFFGVFLAGWPAALFYIAIAALWGWLAFALYRLSRIGWWVAVLALALFAVSNAITYAFQDVVVMYREMGFSPEQIAAMQPYMIKGSPLIWLSAGMMLPWIGYLLFILRYFRKQPSSAG